MTPRNLNSRLTGRPGARCVRRGVAGGWRLWLGRLFLGVGLPMLVLVALEVGLRQMGFGWPTTYFVPGQSLGQPCWVENDRFGWRFFPRSLARHPPPTVMTLEPPARGCRIYVMGESAAMGDPCPAYSMGRYLEVLLQGRYPDRPIEVVTVAMTAINSHALLPMARESARRGGDIWILYLGNNEMVGPFGALDVLGPAAPPWPWVRLRLALQTTALGQGALQWAESWSRRNSMRGWTGMELFAGRRLGREDPRRERVYQNFERNLRDILQTGIRGGVRILVSPAAVNLRDCPPFASETNRFESGATPESLLVWLQRGAAAEATENFPTALEAYRAAVRLAPWHAESHYRLGRVCLRLGRIGEAREAFRLACDLDALPFRADSRIRDIAQRVVSEMPPDRVRFFDAVDVLARRAPDGIPGGESFYEHVHLNPAANYALARAMAEAIEPWLVSLGFSAPATWSSEEECGRQLGLTDWNLALVLDNVRRRLNQPPFTGRSLADVERRLVEREWEAVKARLTGERAAAARETLGLTVQQRPRDFRLRQSQAEFLEAVGDLPGATAAWAEVTRLIPHHHLGWFQQGRLLARLGRWSESEPCLREAVLRRPELSEGWLELGLVRLQQNRPAEALEDFSRAHRLLPQDWRPLYQKGRALARLDRLAEAAEAFQAAVGLNPEAVEPRYQLAETLALLGRPAEAKVLFEEILRREPRHLLARINLGVALVQLGHWEAAMLQFQEAEKLAPGSPLISNYLVRARAHLGQPR